ncbi:MAG: hypothetical protein M1819_003476 [Sarea resinae]|nr:MAG: hypothetical protein M1819_003476 [Sarea resinae]
MFNIFKTVSYSPLQEEDASSSSDYEPFHERGQRAKALIPALPWMVSTFVLGLCLLITLLLDSPFSERESFETGYATEMQAAVHTIELEEVRFWGGIKADENGTFYMHFNPKDEIRYVGKPSRELDDAWDRLTGIVYITEISKLGASLMRTAVGKFIPLTKKESESVRGDISEHRGSYLAASVYRSCSRQCNVLKIELQDYCATQSSLPGKLQTMTRIATVKVADSKTQNYLRQALYDDNYPSIHLVRPHIPDYWLHVGK